jgi:hypothetical protein
MRHANRARWAPLLADRPRGRRAAKSTVNSGCQHRSFVLQKLIDFHRKPATAMAQVMADLDAAAGQVPRDQHRAESDSLVAALAQSRRVRSGEVPTSTRPGRREE